MSVWRLPEFSVWNSVASWMRQLSLPKARKRTAPKPSSRIVTGRVVPQRGSTCWRVRKNYRSHLNGMSKRFFPFYGQPRTGRVAVTSVWRPGPNTAATWPRSTNRASCDSRTVREPPF